MDEGANPVLVSVVMISIVAVLLVVVVVVLVTIVFWRRTNTRGISLTVVQLKLLNSLPVYTKAFSLEDMFSWL